MYFDQNPNFSKKYVDDFVTKTLKDELIPDVLIQTLGEMQREREDDEALDNRRYRLPSDKYLAEAIGLDHLPDNIPYDNSR